MQISCNHRRGVWLAALAFVSMSVTTASAIDPRIVIGGYYQQATDTTSTNPPTEGQCLGVKHCWFLFSPVPTGKQLIVSHVNCQLGFNPGTVRVDAVQLYSQRPDGTPLGNAYYLQPNTKISDGAWNLNTTVLALMGARQRPLILVSIPDAITHMYGACTIAGQIIDAPAP